MTGKKRFLMHYPVGARGDFLCTLLCDDKYGINGTFYSLPPPDKRVVKVHNINNGVISTIDTFPEQVKDFTELFELADAHELIKIKIVAKTIEEKLDIAYFGWIKSIFYGIDRARPYITVDKRDIPNHQEELKKQAVYLITTALTGIDQTQKEDAGYEEKYDYIVNFNDLFNIEFLKEIFEKVNKKPLPLVYIPRLKANISIQNRLSESENYKYFKEMILCHQKIHENYVAIDNLIQQLV
jgi:hypothetical protein